MIHPLTWEDLASEPIWERLLGTYSGTPILSQTLFQGGALPSGKLTPPAGAHSCIVDFDGCTSYVRFDASDPVIGAWEQCADGSRIVLTSWESIIGFRFIAGATSGVVATVTFYD